MTDQAVWRRRDQEPHCIVDDFHPHRGGRGRRWPVMKAIVEPKTKKILGAAVIGEQGGELMSMLELAMLGNLTYDVLRNAVFAHPLYAESLNNLFMQLDEDK